MTSIEWILGICATLGAGFLAALVGIGWKSRETLISLAAEFKGFKTEVRNEFGHIRDDIQRAIPFESRLASVERSVAIITEERDEYRDSFRPNTERMLEDHERRISRLEPNGAGR